MASAYMKVKENDCSRTTTDQESLIFSIDIIQKYSPVQLLLFYMRILGQNLTHVSNNDLPKGGTSQKTDFFRKPKLMYMKFIKKCNNILTLILFTSR